MKGFSSPSPLILQNDLIKSEEGMKELRFKTLNELSIILQNPVTIYCNLTRDLQFSGYGVPIRISVSRKYK